MVTVFDGPVVSQAMTDGEGERVHPLPISSNVQSLHIPGCGLQYALLALRPE
jgi:hypothetical protein